MIKNALAKPGLCCGHIGFSQLIQHVRTQGTNQTCCTLETTDDHGQPDPAQHIPTGHAQGALINSCENSPEALVPNT